ncbi:MAG: hypothetical protein JSW50_06110 [Candidatus Latescibacterota bacterium]|nr:MAG: hypothetical protein JSW50_06110 [Candidatus Latescibacterota bacterium]
MRIYALAALIVLLTATTAGAVVDISIGAFGGMDIPTANDLATSGPLYGIQGKVGFTQFIAVGVFYRASSYGDVEETFFEGEPEEHTATIPGGDGTSFGADVYLGRISGMPGANFYLYGSIGSYKWTRDNLADVSELAYGMGLGVEVVLPFKLGIEGRGVFQVAPTENDGSLKSFIWFIGANYHFGLGN